MATKGEPTKSEEYLNTAHAVTVKISPRTRESYLLELEVLCKLITRWTARSGEYAAAAAALLQLEQLGDLDLDMQMTLMACVRFGLVLIDVQQRRLDSPVVTAFATDLDQCLSRLEEAAGGMAQQSTATQASYM